MRKGKKEKLSKVSCATWTARISSAGSAETLLPVQVSVAV